MNKKLTPWFPDHSKPVHIGEYETSWTKHGVLRRRYWDGKRWRHEGAVCSLQNFYWRGVAEKP